MMTETIFVYGTLRTEFGGRMATWLSRHADFRGMGHFQGTLYEIDRYPGVLPSADRRHRVIGEIYRGCDAVLSVLDEYEQCSGLFPEPHEYRRVQSEITLTDGDTVLAWTYIYNLSTDGLERIHSGDYLHYLQQKTPDRRRC